MEAQQLWDRFGLADAEEVLSRYVFRNDERTEKCDGCSEVAVDKSWVRGIRSLWSWLRRLASGFISVST